MEKQKTKKRDARTTTNINGGGMVRIYIPTHPTKEAAGHAVVSHHVILET